MLRKFFFLFTLYHFFCNPLSLHAEIIVKQLLTPSTVLLSFDAPHPSSQYPSSQYPSSQYPSGEQNNKQASELKVGDRLLVFSQNSKEVSGFLIIQSIENKNEMIARVHYHSENKLILPGDTVQPINYNEKNDNFPGRADLLFTDNKNQSSKYKFLVYQGLSNSETAATIQKNENLLSIFGNYQRGLSDQWTIGSELLANAIGIYNINTKYRFLDTEVITISEKVGYAAYPKEAFRGVQATTYFDIKSNSKIISHTAINLLFIKNNKKINTDQRLGLSSSIESGYEYIFDNWDRLLLGPRYNLDKKTVGGYVAYLWIWNHLHITLGLRTVNFSKLKFDVNDGYAYFFDSFWRF